jgi:hypothetical protein
MKKMFDRSNAACIDSILWAPMVCGKAHYPSKVATPIGDSRTHAGTHYIAELARLFDPLEKAVEFSREYDMELLFYFRLFDDFYPGLEEDFLDSRPDLWWQSRCGHFNLRGWPSYAQPEVRDYKMRLFKELLGYGPDGFMIEIGRSHSMYANPERAANFFGYEAPVAQEFERRYGVDIRQFDYMNGVMNKQGIYANIPYAYEVEYVNAAPFDLEAWHWLKGEYVDSFVREMRAASPGKAMFLQSGICPPHPGTRYEETAKFYVDANALAADGIIDGYSQSGNFKSKSSAEIDAHFFPYYDGVRAAGKPVGVWLNDILTADGGHGALAATEDIAGYIDRALDTTMDFAIIHEADFMTRHEESDEVWQLMGKFKEEPAPLPRELVDAA